MYSKQKDTLATLLAAERYFTRNATRLTGVAGTGLHRDLVATVGELVAQEQAQATGAIAAKQATQTFAALRTALLRDHMWKVATIAGVELPSTPELDPLRAPRTHMSARELAAAATAMAACATPYREVFIAAGLPADFETQLEGAAQAMLAAAERRREVVVSRSAATQGLRVTLSRGRKLIRALDRFVQSTLRTDEVMLLEWKTATQLRRVSKPVVPEAVDTAAEGTAA